MKLLLPISFVAAFELTFFVLAHIARRFRCDRQPGKSRSLERLSANPLGRGIRVSHSRRHQGRSYARRPNVPQQPLALLPPPAEEHPIGLSRPGQHHQSTSKTSNISS
jgi:hypothetical protein